MRTGALLQRARKAVGVSQQELASRAHTSRPTLSAYERGHKSPSLVTAQRLLDQLGYELTVEPRIQFVERPVSRGQPVLVPTSLPRLDASQALATVTLPLHLNWSDPGRSFNMRQRRQRARVYEMVLREGIPEDVLTYIDGLLLLDLWDDLVLPRRVHEAWLPLVRSATGDAA
jgi:transcriptional regulator with XRE-family HTH domain